ncbi:hypothetical protein [Flavobacterium sp. ZB4P13]|uniref:hypothetical protein n=1 Tax=Flavobacterium sp. ZB4P13 TaxID=3401728 RepID=UPI003AAEFB75
MNDRTDVNSFGNNKFFNQDIETTTKSGALADIRHVKNYVEIRSLMINLVKYIINNSDDEKCKTYIRDEFCLAFFLFFNEIDEADKPKIISFLRDSNEAFDDVYIMSSNLNRSILESRYNRFRLYALATIIAPKKFNPKSEVNLNDGDEKLSMNQIALKLVYEGASLPREKANTVITDYGHTSGEKLFQRFTFYSKESNRRANPDGTIKVLKNKIELLDSVIELLPEDKRSKAIGEVKYLKGFLVSLK